MDKVSTLLLDKKYLVQKINSSNKKYLKWVSIQPISDKNTYGTSINPKSVETIYSIFIFEMHKDFIGKEDQDITLDMGINIERNYADSIDRVLGYLLKKNINIDKFIHVFDDPEYPL
jgi:hypothetical protein